MINRSKSSINIGLLILRLTVAMFLLSHGIGKLINGLGYIQNEFGSIGIPKFLSYAVYLGEVVAPILLIIGYRTRLAAVLIVTTFCFIFAVKHADFFTLTAYYSWSLERQGFFFLNALVLIFTGGGRYAISTGSRLD